jgi:hypothetical protein
MGDVFEQYQRGRSVTWYWRQTINAIVTGFATETWRHKAAAASAVALGAYLPQIYTWWPGRWVPILDQLWYPRLIDSRWSWMVINPWAYRLQPYLLTQRLAWCAMLGIAAMIISRFYSRQRRLVLTLFLITQVGGSVPGVLSGWLQEPSNPISFFGLLWSTFFTFVAIPFSILAGGSRIAKGIQRPCD